MKRRPSPFRGIAWQLVGVALIPPFILFIAITAVQFRIAKKDAIVDMRERAQITAAAVGESSAYNIVSGNTAVLERSLQRYIQSDQTISGIAILDNEQKLLVEVGSTRLLSDSEFLEAAILTDVPDINFTSDSQAQLAPMTAPIKTMSTRPVGVVRVYTQVSTLIAERQRRVVITVALIALVTVVCASLGLALAQRLNKPLSLALHALQSIEEGNFSTRIQPYRAGAFQRLHQAINAIAISLGRTQASIDAELQQRTSKLIDAQTLVKKQNVELELMNKKLVDQTNAKNRLIAQMNSTIEEERRKLSHEIHDRLNVNLIAIKHIANRLKLMLLAKPRNLHIANAKSEMIAGTDAIEQSIEEIYKSTRAIVKTLRPEVLDTLGLQQAISELVDTFRLTYSNCKFSFDVETEVLSFAGNEAITAYRFVQESLTNAIKHAQATEIVVRAFRHQHSTVTFVVIDNGVGFDVTNSPDQHGIGIISMQERARSVNGTLRIDSRPTGTRVSLDLPVSPLLEQR